MTDNIKRSLKPIKALVDCYVKPLYIFPKECANAVFPYTRIPCVTAGVNGKNFYFKIGEPVELLDSIWHLLAQVGLIQKAQTIHPPTPNNSFDPIRTKVDSLYAT
ncbi:MAG: hypothetical protein M1445_12475 [Bacteroidetes bacterium]|nr:hypothetical protein [Bacteroidota bacterium]